MYLPRRLCLLIYCLLFIVSCRKKKPVFVDHAYYFWRSSDVTYKEKQYLKQLGVKKIYWHILDVDWKPNMGAVPVFSNEYTSYNQNYVPRDTATLVPVIFITNKTFYEIHINEIRQLAIRIVRRCLPAYDEIDKKYERNHWGDYWNQKLPEEIQFDCDWTAGTASKYFRFLEEVKSLLPRSVKLSATIRLHQYKHPDKTGVPPVERGMLMVYNLSDPKKYAPANSIFETDRAKAYFTNTKKYPLPLDIALPAWSWCIIFRNGEFYQIENGLTEADLKSLAFVEPKGNHFYKITTDTIYRDLFLRPGDEIKAESVDAAQLQEAARLAKKAVNTDSFTVSLFELSEKEFQQFSYETINEVFHSFD